MAEVGKYNSLEVLRQVEHGMYLAGDLSDDILLPTAYIPEYCEIGDILDVFIYRDSEDRIIATTQKPFAIVGEFAALEVIDSTRVGAFMDWGLQKDLLVPFNEQSEKMTIGKKYLVYVYLDEKTDRVVATTRFNKFLNDDTSNLEEGQEVDLIIQKQTPLGFKAIINNQCIGMLFENEIFQAISVGDRLKAYIKLLREDGKVDLILQKTGLQHIDPLTKKILVYLDENNGSMSITDKSPAELIYAKFGVSKRAFKQAIGKLYKKRTISIDKNQITLIS